MSPPPSSMPYMSMELELLPSAHAPLSVATAGPLETSVDIGQSERESERAKERRLLTGVAAASTEVHTDIGALRAVA